MAGPSVAVRILGDLTGWSKSVSGTADTAQAGASRIKGAFSSVLGQLNKTGVLGPFGSTLDQVSSSLDGLGKKAASNSEKMIAGGGAMLALGVGIQALGSKEVEAQNALATTIKNTGKTYDQYTTQINAAVKAEEKHGETADETMTALQRLTQATHSPTEALKLLAEASDLAAAKHEDLGSAATALGRVYNGNTKLLKEFGITVKATTDPVKALATATKASQKADMALADAKEKLTSAQARSIPSTTTSTSATLRLDTASRSLSDATAVLAEKHRALTSAHNAVTNATTEQRNAVEDLGTAYTGSAKQLKAFGTTAGAAASSAKHVTSATDSYAAAARRVADARAHLSDLETIGTTVTSHASGATSSLMDAQQKLSDAATIAAEKHKELAQAQTDAANASKNHATAVGDLAKVITGQADAASDSFTGKLQALRAEVTDDVVTFANKYGPSITAAGAAMTGLGATIEIVKGAQDLMKDSTILSTIATDAQKASTVVATAAQWLFNAAMDANPIVLVAVAIAALGAALVLAYTHVSAFRDGINDLWQFIVRAFDGIKSAVGAVFDWLSANWPLVLGILTGPFGLAAAAIATHWADVETFVKAIPGRIEAVFADASTWLVDAGKDIVKGLTNGIKNAAKGAVNAVKHLGSDVIKGAKSILHIGSPSTLFESFGRDTVAGYVNGLRGAAGDAVSTMGAAMGAVVGAAAPTSTVAVAGAGGPLVHMDHVTIASGVDVDLVAQKVSAALVAGRV